MSGPGMGHNRGPAMDAGVSRRRHRRGRARGAAAEAAAGGIRQRVARARQIGLDHTRHATVRATTGRGSVAFVFSANALRQMHAVDARDARRAARLAAIAGFAGHVPAGARAAGR